MPRQRGTREGAAKLIGRLLLLVVENKETSASLSKKLGVSSRQVNRYIAQLNDAGWAIERVGVPTHGDYWIELKSPKIELKGSTEAREIREGSQVNHKLVYRLCCEEGVQLRTKTPGPRSLGGRTPRGYPPTPPRKVAQQGDGQTRPSPPPSGSG